MFSIASSIGRLPETQAWFTNAPPLRRTSKAACFFLRTARWTPDLPLCLIDGYQVFGHDVPAVCRQHATHGRGLAGLDQSKEDGLLLGRETR